MRSSTYLSRVTGGSGSSPSFNNYDIGAGDSNKRIFIAVHWQEGGSHFNVAGVTIGGVAHDFLTQRGHTGGLTGFGCAIASAIVPTAGLVTVEPSFSGSVAECEISGISVVGLSNLTRTDTATDQTSGTADDLDGLIDVPANGFLMAAFTSSTKASGDAVAWTGVTEQYDASTSGVRSSMAWNDMLSLQANRPIEISVATQTDAGNAFVAVSWA